MPRTPVFQLLALRREHVHRQVRSGLTIAQFCVQ
jgi:hypothetical protein